SEERVCSDGVLSGDWSHPACEVPDCHPVAITRSGTGTGQVTSIDATIDCGDVCEASLEAGSQLVLLAEAGFASTFAGWSGDCAGTGACTLELTGPRAVAATF